MADGPYLESERSDGGEQAFADFVATVGSGAADPGTFSPAPGGLFARAWALWLERSFRPLLAPALSRAHRHASLGQIEELAQVDRELDLALPRATAERSRLASAPFFEGRSEIRARREWERYQGLVARGGSPGHLPVVFACQAALFHLPLAQTLLSYGSLEFSRGREAYRGGRRLAADDAEREALLALLLPEVSLALASKFGQVESGREGSGLKAI